MLFFLYYCFQGFFPYMIGTFFRRAVIDSGIFIYFVNGRTRNNIMKLMKQNTFPAVIQFLSGIASSQDIGE